MKKLGVLAIAMAFAFMAAPVMANPQGGPPHDDKNDCGEYCWLGFITPINANVNFADIDSNIDTTALTGGNKAWTNVEVEDMHFSNATINLPQFSVTSGEADAFSTQSIMANMIEPLACNGCADTGIYANVNVALLDSVIDTTAKTGGNTGSLKEEIEDLCHSNATINGGAATVTSSKAWAQTTNDFAVNFIGDWTK